MAEASGSQVATASIVARRTLDEPGSRKAFFTTLDGIRGLAAILVVARHSEPLLVPIAFPETFLAVDIFFVLSGVVLAQAYEARLRSNLTTLRFAWIRIVRIYPLYLLGSAIAVLGALVGLYGPISPPHLALYVLLALFLLPKPGSDASHVFPLNAPAWSLFFELAANIVYAAAIRILTNAALLAIMLICSAGLVLSLYLAPHHDLDLGFRFSSFVLGFFRVGYSFFAGVLIYRRYARRPRVASARRSAIMTWAVLLLLGALLVARPGTAIRPLYDFLAVTVLFPLIVRAALPYRPLGVTARICAFLGAISYAIYAIHSPLSVIVQALLQSPGPVACQHAAPWSGIAFLLLLLPLCWAIDAVYDAPIRRRLLALTAPRRTAG